MPKGTVNILFTLSHIYPEWKNAQPIKVSYPRTLNKPFSFFPLSAYCMDLLIYSKYMGGFREN